MMELLDLFKEQQSDRCDWNDKRNNQILDRFQWSRIGRCRFNVGCGRKEDIRDYTKVLGLSNWKNEVNHLMDGEDLEKREKEDFSLGHIKM